MFIQDSRRSYRTYTYTDVCLFRTPVRVTELILIRTYPYNRLMCIQDSRRSYETYSYLTDLILVLQNLLLYFEYRSTRRYYRTFYWYKSTRRYYRTDSLFGGTRRYHWTSTYLTDMGVLVGTTELVLIY